MTRLLPLAVTLATACLAPVALAQSPAPCPQLDRTERYFPTGSGPADAVAGWRLSWQMLPATAPNGPGAKWVITGAEFLRRDEAGRAQWLRVLDHLHLSEMYVPYDSGHELFDVSANGFSFAPIAQHGAVARPAPAAPCHHNGVILEEIRDDDVRWIDDRRNSLVRRGQELVVWAALDAGNYRYIVRYGFADDGSVRARVGATAANLHHRRPDRDPSQNVEARDDIHVHMAGWRIELNLGRPEANNVALVERRPCSAPEVSCAVGRGAVLQRRPFEREGGVRWSPEAFSMLAIENGEPPTPRRPMARQGYTLIPRSAGAVRSSRPFGDNDFWVTRRDPDATGAGGCPQRIAPEWTYVDLPTFGACPQALSGQAAVIWHQSAAYHWPRGEDFGPEGQDRTAGVATTAWSGFDLVPRDVVVGTPLFDR